MPPPPTHILDAAAVIAYLKGELGQEVVAALIANESNRLAIHSVNLCEVYYGYFRSDGIDVATDAWSKATAFLAVIERADEEFIKRVGRWKAEHLSGLADSFAAATAEEYGCPLVTTDHGDFDPVEAAGVLTLVWVR